MPFIREKGGLLKKLWANIGAAANRRDKTHLAGDLCKMIAMRMRGQYGWMAKATRSFRQTV